MDEQELLILLLKKTVEKNNHIVNMSYELAAQSRDDEKKIECDFYYRIRDNNVNYSEFDYIEYRGISFEDLFTKYLKENYDIEWTSKYDKQIVPLLLKQIERDRKLNQLGI